MLGHQTQASASLTFHLSCYSLQMNEFITKSCIFKNVRLLNSTVKKPSLTFVFSVLSEF